MKKKELFLTIIVLSFTFFGCDVDRYYDYYIINNCNEIIEIKLIDKNNNNSNLQIEPKMEQLVYSGDDYQALKDFMVEIFFKKIIITKGDKTSKVNYVNKDLWDFKKTSKNHADSYLTVNPEDFE